MNKNKNCLKEKKLLVFGAGKKGFRRTLGKKLSQEGIKAIFTRYKYLSFLIQEGKVQVYNKGKLLDLSDIGYVYTRAAGDYKHPAYLMYSILKYYNIPANDFYSYFQHDKAEEKTAQMISLPLAGVEVPTSLIFSLDAYSYASASIKKYFSFPFVLKIDSSRGRGVWKIENQKQFQSKLDELSKQFSTTLVLVQEYIPNTFDIRAIFWRNEYLGAIKRISTDGFYNNASKGAKIEKYELNKKELSVAKKAMKALKFDFAGVDLIYKGSKPIIMEVNLSPQIKAFSKVNKDKSVYEFLINHFKKEAKC